MRRGPDAGTTAAISDRIAGQRGIDDSREGIPAESLAADTNTSWTSLS